jgi:hypothetical protein
MGCGADESAEAALSKGQFAKRADLICTKAANEQPEKAATFLDQHPNADEVDLIEPALLPPLESMVEELKKLGLPRGAEAQAQAFLDEVDKALGEVKNEPKLALDERHNPFSKANELGRKLKLGDCGQNP